MDVTLVRVVDPVEPANEFFTPPEGSRWLAVQIRLANVGSATYQDSPGNGARLLDGEGQEYGWAIFEAAGCPVFVDGTATVPPGQERLGCIGFEVPTDTALVAFTLALDSGFGPESGRWELAS